MNPNTWTVYFLQLNTSGHSMPKVVALNKYLEDTHSQIVALKTNRTIPNGEFANFEVLQSCNYHKKGGVSLLVRKNLSFCDTTDLKTNEVDAVWSIAYLERCS